MTRKPPHLFITVPFLLIIVALALAGIGADPIWYDEYLSLRFAGFADDQFDVLRITSRIVENGRGEALVFDILLALWCAFTGWSAFAARLFSMLLGVLSLAWLYRLGADIHSPFAGLCSAILLGVCALFGVYLHEIRTYSLLILEVVLLIWVYIRIQSAGRSWVLSTSFALVHTAALYSHPFVAPVILALGFYHLVLAPRTKSWLHLLALLAFCYALYAPYAVITFGVAAEFATTLRRVYHVSNAELILAVAQAVSSGHTIFLLLPFLSLRRLRSDTGVRMLWVLVLVFSATMLIANEVSDVINQIRYFIPVLPLFWLLGGIACASLPAQRVLVALILVAWSIAGILAEPGFRKSLYIPDEYAILHVAFPLDELIDDIRDDANANDLIIFEFPHRHWAIKGIIGYYMKGAETRYVLTEALGSGENPAERLSLFREILSTSERAYFVSDRSIVSGDFLEDYERILSDRYLRCQSVWDTEQARADKFAAVPTLCGPPAQALIHYESQLALLDFEHEETAMGHSFYSTWSADLPTDTYSLSIRVWDSNGQLRYQRDDALPLGDFNYRIDHLSLDSLPTDIEFGVEAVVYNWRTGGRLQTAAGADVALIYAVGD